MRRRSELWVRAHGRPVVSNCRVDERPIRHARAGDRGRRPHAFRTSGWSTRCDLFARIAPEGSPGSIPPAVSTSLGSVNSRQSTETAHHLPGDRTGPRAARSSPSIVVSTDRCDHARSHRGGGSRSASGRGRRAQADGHGRRISVRHTGRKELDRAATKLGGLVSWPEEVASSSPRKSTAIRTRFPTLPS